MTDGCLFLKNNKILKKKKKITIETEPRHLAHWIVGWLLRASKAHVYLAKESSKNHAKMVVFF
jgi:hypothetical protein